MGIIELLIVILVLAWLFGYFGRGRWYGGSSGSVAVPSIASGSWVHMLLVIVVILVVLRLLGLG